MALLPSALKVAAEAPRQGCAQALVVLPHLCLLSTLRANSPRVSRCLGLRSCEALCSLPRSGLQGPQTPPSPASVPMLKAAQQARGGHLPRSLCLHLMPISLRTSHWGATGSSSSPCENMAWEEKLGTKATPLLCYLIPRTLSEILLGAWSTSPW